MATKKVAAEEIKETIEKVEKAAADTTKKATKTVAATAKKVEKAAADTTKKATKTVATTAKKVEKAAADTTKKATKTVASTTKKAAAAVKAVETEVYVQFQGREVALADLIDRARKAAGAKGAMKLYVKPEDGACYYVDGDNTGKIEF